MKMTQTLYVNKTELDALKTLMVTAADEFGKKLSMSELNEKFSHQIRMKTTVGNMMTMLNLSDTYELVYEIEIHDDIFVEIVHAFGEVLPMVSGIVRTMIALNDRMIDRMEVLEMEINGELQDVE